MPMEIDTSYNQIDREIEKLNFYDANTVMFSCIFILYRKKKCSSTNGVYVLHELTYLFLCFPVSDTNQRRAAITHIFQGLSEIAGIFG